MRFLKYIAGIAILALFYVNSFSQIRVNMQADTNQILIGDFIHLNFELIRDKEVQINYPAWGDTLSIHFEVLEIGKIDTLPDKDRIQLSQKVSVTSYDSGLFYIPPVHIDYLIKGDSILHFVETDPIPIMVIAPTVDLQKGFIDIKKPMEAKFSILEILPYILGGILLLGLLVLVGIYLYKYFKRKADQPKIEKPPLPPKEWAIKQLEELRLKKLWQQGREKEYFTELVDILREYVHYQFNVDSFEMTSEELKEGISSFNINSDAINKLSVSLEISDLVKFAKFKPTPLENDLALLNGIDFVNESTFAKKLEEEKKAKLENERRLELEDEAKQKINDNEAITDSKPTLPKQKEEMTNSHEKYIPKLKEGGENV
jgi:hypothetical protein